MGAGRGRRRRRRLPLFGQLVALLRGQSHLRPLRAVTLVRLEEQEAREA